MLVVTRIALLACVLVLPLVQAGPLTCVQDSGVGPHCVPPDRMPQDVAGAYDDETSVLTVSWTAPADTVAPDAYVVYRDGQVLATVTGLSISDDLSGFTGQHVYEVAGRWGLQEGDTGLPVTVQRLNGASGGMCAGIVVGEVPPIFVHPDECL